MEYILLCLQKLFHIWKKNRTQVHFESSETGLRVSTTNKLYPLHIGQFPDRVSQRSCVITGINEFPPADQSFLPPAARPFSFDISPSNLF